jgi:hypothetical protein
MKLVSNALGLCVLGAMFGIPLLGPVLIPGRARAATQDPEPYCTAEEPVDFICPYEFNPNNPNSKWRSITVTSSAVSSGGSCANSCTFSFSVTMTARSGTYGTYDVTGGTSSTVVFSASDDSETFANSSLVVPCGGSSLFDVSYQSGNCPSECPSGPGPCSIVAITFTCGPDC